VLTRNAIIKSKYVGIFEYDCEIKKDFFKLNLKPDAIVGFLRRELPDDMYIESVPVLKSVLTEQEMVHAGKQGFWCPTTNFILPVRFLADFVAWYEVFIPQLLPVKNHPHAHERAIHVYAVNHGVEVEYAEDYLIHEQLCSHGVNFDDQ
jgi:hypothetical protein